MHEQDTDPDPNPEDEALDRFVDVVPDDQLRLMFLCCHPALAADSQVALTLRLLGGLETGEIARAFLLPEDHRPTDRASETEAARQPRPVPHPWCRRAPRSSPRRSGVDLSDLHRRTHRHRRSRPHPWRPLNGSDPHRTGPRHADARRAGGDRTARLDAADRGAPIKSCRRPRRHGSSRRPGPLTMEPNLIAEGHGLVRACLRRDQPGPFQIQAVIAAVHTDAPTAADTDWSQIVALYDQLYEIAPNPVVALNRAVAVGMLAGGWSRSRAGRPRRRQRRRLPAIPRRPSRPAHQSGTSRRSDRGLRPRHRTHNQPRRARVPQPATPTSRHHHVTFLT